MKHSVIALITDFGLSDVYVGVMKGTILSLNPEARIVDITHSIPRHDIMAGSHALMASYRYFPEGTVFVVVVDPGVGSDRAIICAESEGRYFLAPDNGVLGAILTERGYDSLVKVGREDLYIKPVSATFHGRDVFAPVAAHLSMGMDMADLGERAHGFARIDIPVAEVTAGRVAACVLWVDSFGNIVTNVSASAVRDVISGWSGIGVEGRAHGLRLVGSYEAVAPGSLLAIVGSSGFLEFSVRGGSAARTLELSPGDRLVLVESAEA